MPSVGISSYQEFRVCSNPKCRFKFAYALYRARVLSKRNNICALSAKSGNARARFLLVTTELIIFMQRNKTRDNADGEEFQSVCMEPTCDLGAKCGNISIIDAWRA